MQNKVCDILQEIQKVILGKKEVVEKVMMAILADGHILLDDVPGVGKTTLAVALGKALGLAYQRIQFTPDVLRSDIVGFSIYDKSTGNFKYMPGTVNRANLLLADEIVAYITRLAIVSRGHPMVELGIDPEEYHAKGLYLSGGFRVSGAGSQWYHDGALPACFRHRIQKHRDV